MANRLEKLADKIISLTPQEAEELALIVRAKIMPKMQAQQGLLQQQQMPVNPQMAQMGRPRQGGIRMPTGGDAARQGLLY